VVRDFVVPFHRFMPGLALAVAACAQQPERDDLAFEAAPVSQLTEAGAWHSQLSGAAGAFDAQTRFDLAHGDARTTPEAQPGMAPLQETQPWTGTLAQQSTAQDFAVHLPAPQAPVDLKLSFSQQSLFGPAGLYSVRAGQASVRWAPGPLSVQVDPLGQGLEVAARHSLDFSGLKLPLTASWQRTAPQWSLAGGSQQTALAVNLAPGLRNWLGPRAGANVSWQWLRPDDPALTPDQRIMMGLSYGW
jgi:hypothetical protein